MKKLENDWDLILEPEFKKDYYLSLRSFLIDEYKTQTIYPPMNDIYNAFRRTPYSKVRVVILGQDPYIHKDEAHGLAFSVNKGVKIPPSLSNVYKEIISDVGGTMPEHGCLYKWTEQGVMLLNTTLTVRGGASMSHKNHGWEIFTDNIIQILNNKPDPLIFLLWGNHAKSKQSIITNPAHLVLTAAHPSPLAGGAFFGCKHFSKTNNFLIKNGYAPLDWQID